MEVIQIHNVKMEALHREQLQKVVFAHVQFNIPDNGVKNANMEKLRPKRKDLTYKAKTSH